MSLNKTVTGIVLFAGTETTYGLGATLTGSTNTIQVVDALPVFDVKYSFDGRRKGGNYSGGNIRGTTPSGRTTEATVKMEVKGLGSAYTTASAPPNIHPFLLASGLSGSFNGSAWVYKPLPFGTTPLSLAAEVYDRGEKLPVSGAYCDMTIASNGAGITTAEFKLMGIPADTTDVASPPARTFTAASVIPPKNELVALTIGAYSGSNVRSYTYAHGLTIAPRISLNATGSHAGFALGRRNPSFKLTIEADALSAFDAYGTWKNAIQNNITFTVGTAGTNNSFTLQFPSASLSDVQRKGDGPLATWDLTFDPAISVPDASDDFILTFNS